MMNPPPRLSHLYAILDAAQLAGRPLVQVAESLLAAGVRWIQYRDKRASSRELYEAAALLAAPVRAAGGTLIINDRADIAQTAGAAGAHLGQEDLPPALARRFVPEGFIIGVSTHSLSQALEADREPVDYIAFGPIFATQSKENPSPVVGLSGLAEARRAAHKPIVAIGGITLENAPTVIAHGADSVAVIGALLGVPDVGKRAREFLERLEPEDRR